MSALFWIAIGVVAYVYVGYPLVLRLLSRLVGKDEVARAEVEPTVTMLISAYNEEAILEAKLQNALALDYPPERIEIAVVSDASTDRTDEIARAYADRGVVLLRMPTRSGKSRGLNAAVPAARGDVLVFSDANALYRPDAIRKLVRNFHDPRVGCVTGESRYVGAERSAVGRQESRYWAYERRLKIDETSLGSMVGGDGAIFAIRRSLYEPLAVTDINDFVTPLQVVAKGYRAVYEPDAVCEERGTAEHVEEFRRKARIVNRSAFALHALAGLLNPFRHGWFAFQFLSHKVLRWSVPIWLFALLGTSTAIAHRSVLYRGALVAQIGFYGVAVLCALVPALRTPRLHVVSMPYYFCVVNLAALRGLAGAVTGRVQVTWTPERRQGQAAR